MRNVLVVVAAQSAFEDASVLAEGLAASAPELGTADIVSRDRLDAALAATPWDVVVVAGTQAGVGVLGTVGRVTRELPDALCYVASFAPPERFEDDVTTCIEAGALAVLPGRQTRAVVATLARGLADRDARRALTLQNQRILAAAGEGIYGLDLEGRTTFINPAAARLIDWSRDDLLGKPQHAILHHSHADGSPYPREECPIYAALRDGAVHAVRDEVFWRKDGTSFPVEYVSTPMISDGAIVGAVVVFRDVTEQRALERRLAENVERLEAAQAELVQVLEQLLATEELALAGQRVGAAAREVRAALGRLREAGHGGARDVGVAQALAEVEATLDALAYLSSEPAPAPAPAVELGPLVRDALHASPTGMDGGVRAAAAAADVHAIVRLLGAWAGPGAEVRVGDDDGAPTIAFRAARASGRPRSDDARLSLLFARRLAGRTTGAIETRHERDGAVTLLLRLAPALAVVR